MVASYSPFIFLVSLKIMIGKISLLHPLIFFNAKILTAWLWLATEGKIPSSVDNMRERRQFILFPQLQFNARNFNDVSYYYDNPYFPIVPNPEAESNHFNIQARVPSKPSSSSIKHSSKGYVSFLFILFKVV